MTPLRNTDKKPIIPKSTSTLLAYVTASLILYTGYIHYSTPDTDTVFATTLFFSAVAISLLAKALIVFGSARATTGISLLVAHRDRAEFSRLFGRNPLTKGIDGWMYFRITIINIAYICLFFYYNDYILASVFGSLAILSTWNTYKINIVAVRATRLLGMSRKEMEEVLDKHS